MEQINHRMRKWKRVLFSVFLSGGIAATVLAFLLDRTFPNAHQPNRAQSVLDALKTYQYEMGFAYDLANPIIEHFYQVTFMTEDDDRQVHLHYDYLSGNIHGLVSEKNKSIIGIWDDDGKGDEGFLFLSFSLDHQVAHGWWSYGHQGGLHERYNLRLKRVA